MIPSQDGKWMLCPNCKLKYPKSEANDYSDYSEYKDTSKGKKSKLPVICIILVIITLVIIAGVVFFLLKSGKDSDETAHVTEEEAFEGIESKGNDSRASDENESPDVQNIADVADDSNTLSDESDGSFKVIEQESNLEPHIQEAIDAYIDFFNQKDSTNFNATSEHVTASPIKSLMDKGARRIFYSFAYIDDDDIPEVLVFNDSDEYEERGWVLSLGYIVSYHKNWREDGYYPINVGYVACNKYEYIPHSNHFLAHIGHRDDSGNEVGIALHILYEYDNGICTPLCYVQNHRVYARFKGNIIPDDNGIWEDAANSKYYDEITKEEYTRQCNEAFGYADTLENIEIDATTYEDFMSHLKNFDKIMNN